MIPLVTPLSSGPNRATMDADEYVVAADVTMSELPVMVDELNASIEAMNTTAAQVEEDAAASEESAGVATAAATAATNATTLVRSISDNLTVGAGAKNLTGLDNPVDATFADDDDVFIIRRSDHATRMRGVASACNMAAGTMTVTVAAGQFAGTGTHDDWLVVHADLASVMLGVAADLLLGTSALAALTAAAIYEALDEETLTDAATIAVDMSTFINAKVTLGGNRTLGNPTNPKPGQTGRIRAIQDGTGGRTLSFASNWKRQGGAPTLDAAANHSSVIEYDVITPTFILYDLIQPEA